MQKRKALTPQGLEEMFINMVASRRLYGTLLLGPRYGPVSFFWSPIYWQDANQGLESNPQWWIYSDIGEKTKPYFEMLKKETPDAIPSGPGEYTLLDEWKA